MDKQKALMRLRAQAITKSVKADQKATRAWRDYTQAEHRAERDSGTSKYARAVAKSRAKYSRFLQARTELHRADLARERASRKAFPKAKR